MKVIVHLLLLIVIAANIPAQIFAQRKKNRVQPSANFTIQQLAPRVWVAINNDNYGKAICNAGIVDLGNRTLVFDPFMNPAAAVELREAAKKLTGKSVSIVVNSHYHNDHIRGNQVFVPNVTIISTTITKAHIEANEEEEQEWEKQHAPTLLQALRKRMVNATAAERVELPYWIGYYEGLVESAGQLYTAVPDQTFDDSLWIEGSKLSVKLVERKNGHTESDVVLLIPSLGIAFMGDLLCSQRHPWISDGTIDGWKESLKVFYEDTLYHTYLPGHGKVSEKPALKSLYEYFTDVQQLCDSAHTEEAETALMNQPIPSAYSRWKCARFYQPNLQYLIQQAKAKSQGKTSAGH